jgi:hypothetical protein
MDARKYASNFRAAVGHCCIQVLNLQQMICRDMKLINDHSNRVINLDEGYIFLKRMQVR